MYVGNGVHYISEMENICYCAIPDVLFKLEWHYTNYNTNT